MSHSELSLAERLDRYGDTVPKRLKSFPMSRGRSLVRALEDFAQKVVRESELCLQDIRPPGVSDRSTSLASAAHHWARSRELIKRHRALTDSIQEVFRTTHTPTTDPFVREQDGSRAISARGDYRRRSLSGWLAAHVEARDGDSCQLCGVGPERPVECVDRLISGPSGGWYRVRTGPARSDMEKVQGREAAWEQAAQVESLPVRFQVDHILPAFHNGPNMAWNLWRLCRDCNDRKGWFVWPETLRESLDSLAQVRAEL